MSKKEQELSAFKIIKPQELNALRAKLHEEQDEICPILKLKLPIESMVLDHEHRKNRQQPIGENGAGLIRGVIQRHANALEGKISNAWRRYGMDRYDITISDFLRNLADYLDRPNTDIIYPSELPRPKIIKKSCYNKLVKAIDGKQKIPDYRVDGKGNNKQKMTKSFEKLFVKYEIEVEYYGD